MKKSFKEITIMNAFLCLCVIMIHVTSAPTINFAYGSAPYVLLFAISKLFCFSVPAFIFLSGCKLHNKYKDNIINIAKFYTGRLKTIVLPYLVSVLIYFLYYYQKGWVLISDLPEYIFLGTLSAQFYYIVIAVQFYLVFPLLLPLFSRFPKTFTAISFIVTISFLEFFTFTYSDRFIGTYLFYFALGMFFSEYKIYEKSRKICIFSICAAVIFGIAHTLCLYMSTSGEFTYSYAGIIYIIYVTCAISAIYTIATICGEKLSLINRISSAISYASYDIYLYHILVMAILQYDVFLRISLTAKEQLLVIFVTVYGLTFIYTAIKSKLKRRSLK